MPKQNFGLGRGLGSLIPSKDNASQQKQKQNFSSVAPEQNMPKDSDSLSRMIDIEVEKVESNRHNPRKYFDEEKLNELAESIKAHGIIQPLVVVPSNNGKYELIAGERRLRASKLAGLKTVPAIVRQADELERLELALIENIQRADLNPIEEALAYQKLNDEFGLTHDEIGKRVNKTRPLISNAIRLLALDPEIQKAVAERKITTGHARLILEIQDEAKRMQMFKKILDQKLNISDTSQEVKKVEINRHTRTIIRDPNIEELEKQLRDALGTKVMIGRRGTKVGLITIEFYGEDELKQIASKIISP
ncbi:MAG: chromosome partitioning protein ParB [Parcubacteria group bacterium CG_4_9_14_0_2_um_filter_41_8]|nr:MAG: hypothetical protein AUJ34_00565 [Parcubacteria group bacterium CG1_02_41_12]PIP67055.1 MAG: chromosome partitioning protein ParB [Parcubacteria group bacterium CG22_combo_CG10-13_8_21_14_all_41_9]PIQ79773.1 MAG: chromosome partitioning protein ParB [Parcubacteria group bacterium CG11_big_fil_rev_8_21_14_0_20_41_14]PIR57603.1 MAG: chromosome partitioning protein ParB [Parcubacteria group bacterium CG10_big_fil_rev_8_21_14_0_10_41_35]PIZ82375.1 MAG: chromosome partitioning protein ParB [